MSKKRITSTQAAKDLVDGIQTAPLKRKRGRPRKNETVRKQIQKKKAVSDPIPYKHKSNSDVIILRLPITFKDVEKYGSGKYYTKKTPLGANGRRLRGHEKENYTSYNKNIFTITDASASPSSDSSLDDNGDTSELIKLLKQKDKTIAKLRAEIEDYRSVIDSEHLIGIKNRSVKKIENNLIKMVDGKSTVVDKTNIYCWHCGHKFDNIPCFLPEKILEGVYYVFGVFCCCPCSMAYNISINDYKVGERHSLIKKMYDLGDKLAPIAPKREVFEKYGGYLTYEKYRRNIVSNQKEYTLIMPPMTSIAIMIEEGYVDTSKYDRIRTYNTKDNLVLRRTKPLPGANRSLTKALGIKKKKRRRY